MKIKFYWFYGWQYMKEINLYNIECTIISNGYDFPKTSNVKEEINNFFQKFIKS